MGTALEKGLVLQGRINLVEKIGQGGQAQVWRVKEIEVDRELAAKLVVIPKERRSEISKEAIDAEIKKLSVLSSNFIVIMHYAVYELMDDSGDIVVGYTMPLANGGTLESNKSFREKLRSERRALNETMLQIGRGISIIHDQNIVHGDIKPSNVLLFNERKLTHARVSDLGAAYLVGLGFGIAFDPRYAAPERFNSRYETATAYDKKRSDIYSLGMLFFELITGKYAYGDDLYFEFPYQSFHNLHETQIPNWELVPKAFSSLLDTLKRMLAKNPADRPSIDELTNILEGTRSAGQIQTEEGQHRDLKALFPQSVFVWNPKLHKKFNHVKKIFLLRSPTPFELESNINLRLLEEFPNLGFTLYVTFGASDIVLTTWELDESEGLMSAIAPLVKKGREPIDEYVSRKIIYRDSVEREAWEDFSPAEITKEIVANSGQGDLETEQAWLKKRRFIFGKLLRVAEHGIVRLLLRVEANKPMDDREHNLIVQSMLDFLRVQFIQSKGKKVPYPYRIYTDIESKNGGWKGVQRKFLFVEIYGWDIYMCSRAVLGLIRAVEAVPFPTDQYFNFSSYIQFHRENVSESEDGALIQILSAQRR